MNKKMYVLCVVLMAFSGAVYASDWDKAGKILTGIEGLRVVSGGKVDIIGGITGINRGSRYRGSPQPIVYQQHVCAESCRRWVPNIVWETRWVPGHFVYDRPLGMRRYVAGHYEQYQVERGGYWVSACLPARGVNYTWSY